MVTYNNFLSEDECEYIINYSKKIQSIENVTPNRNIEFYHINDYTDFSFLEDKLYNINVINKPVFNINKYKKGYYFLPHIDRGGKNDPNGERLKTIIVNLSKNSSYSGGELYVNNKLINSKQGFALSFDSSTVHEVKKLTNGYRYSLVFWLKKHNIKSSFI